MPHEAGCRGVSRIITPLLGNWRSTGGSLRTLFDETGRTRLYLLQNWKLWQLGASEMRARVPGYGWSVTGLSSGLFTKPPRLVIQVDPLIMAVVIRPPPTE